MNANPNVLPVVDRPDAAIVQVSQWRVGTPATAEFERASWPDGLISLNWFTSTDGESVLAYAQWTSEEACREYTSTHRSDVGRPEPVEYRLYRSAVSKDAKRVPGCIVVVSVEFDGPDPQRQRKWVDTVFEALEAETALHPGGISGHFHLSTDGTRVLNYAEWADEASHQEAIEASGQGSIGSGPKWRLVRNFPGIVSSGFKRYHFARSLGRPQQSSAA